MISKTKVRNVENNHNTSNIILQNSDCMYTDRKKWIPYIYHLKLRM